MRRNLSQMFALMALLPLAACGGTSTAPLDPVTVREHLDFQLFQLQTAIEREDLTLASAPIGESFTVANNVALLWRDKNWEGSGPGAFRGFLADVFELHANIQCELLLVHLEQSGDLATATVAVTFRSQRTDAVPAGQFLIQEDNYFVFERTGSSWRMIRWLQTPGLPPAA